MSGKDLVRVGGWEVDRSVLDDVGRELRLYPARVNRLTHLRRLIALVPHESAPPADGMPRGSDVGNPVLGKVERIEKLEAEVRLIEAWLKTVDDVMDTLDDRQQEIVKHLFLLPRKEQEFTLIGIGKRLSMGVSEAYRTKDEAILAFAMVLRGTDIVEDNGKNTGKSGEARPPEAC